MLELGFEDGDTMYPAVVAKDFLQRSTAGAGVARMSSASSGEGSVWRAPTTSHPSFSATDALTSPSSRSSEPASPSGSPSVDSARTHRWRRPLLSRRRPVEDIAGRGHRHAPDAVGAIGQGARFA
jgi:hypothetical protein